MREITKSANSSLSHTAQNKLGGLKKPMDFLESERIRKLQSQIDQKQALLNLVYSVRKIYRYGFSSGKPIFRPQRKKSAWRIMDFQKNL